MASDMIFVKGCEICNGTCGVNMALREILVSFSLSTFGSAKPQTSALSYLSLNLSGNFDASIAALHPERSGVGPHETICSPVSSASTTESLIPGAFLLRRFSRLQI